LGVSCAVTHPLGDVTVWIDSGDDRILDEVDDVQVIDDFDSGLITMTFDRSQKSMNGWLWGC